MTVSLIVAVCDLCGRRNVDSECSTYYTTPEAAVADPTTVYTDYDGATAWALTADGRLICDRADQAHHELRIAVHGWHPTGGAMSLTFTPAMQPHTAHP
ncbi:hypothetical protein [Streptomyces sp. NPDC004134]|uniref:hypothetical protein n=1 Tax=Streptomyces sp. NPDC004134 TaxID=3364691 RepID=UPI0036A9BE79